MSAFSVSVIELPDIRRKVAAGELLSVAECRALLDVVDRFIHVMENEDEDYARPFDPNEQRLLGFRSVE